MECDWTVLARLSFLSGDTKHNGQPTTCCTIFPLYFSDWGRARWSRRSPGSLLTSFTTNTAFFFFLSYSKEKYLLEGRPVELYGWPWFLVLFSSSSSLAWVRSEAFTDYKRWHNSLSHVALNEPAQPTREIWQSDHPLFLHGWLCASSPSKSSKDFRPFFRPYSSSLTTPVDL